MKILRWGVAADSDRIAIVSSGRDDFFLTAKIAITQEGSKGYVHELTDEIHLVCLRRSDLDVLPVLLLSSADIHPRSGRI